MRAFFVCGKRCVPDAHYHAHFENGHFLHNGKRMSAIAARRHNARALRINRGQEYFMRRRPFAFAALY